MEHHYAGDPGYLLGTPFPQHRVWDKIRALYPNLDQATSDAIESRLCRFDVI